MSIRKTIKHQNAGNIPALDRYQILNKIKQINNTRNQALISFLYLSGCRIEEALQYKHYKEKILGEGIKKEQIEISNTHILILNVRCLKLFNQKTLSTGEKIRTHRAEFRNIPIPIVKRDLPLIQIFLEYIKGLPEQALLFNIGRVMAYKILSQVGLFPHLLRHSRLTHLTIDHNFTESELRKFTGWSTSETAKHYVHLNTNDLVEKIIRTS